MLLIPCESLVRAIIIYFLLAPFQFLYGGNVASETSGTIMTNVKPAVLCQCVTV